MKIRAHVQALFEEGDFETLFTHGACHIFALELHALYEYPLVACRRNDGGISHCFAMRGDKGIDAKGPIERPRFREEFEFSMRRPIAPVELAQYFQNLFPDEENCRLADGLTFNQTLRKCARSFIFHHEIRFAP